MKMLVKIDNVLGELLHIKKLGQQNKLKDSSCRDHKKGYSQLNGKI